MRFRNRTEAGQRLANKLTAYANRPDVLVLGLPRGGVPVAFALAHALHLPMDVLVVRKLGLPGEEELAMGAIASGGVRILNDDVVRAFGVSPATVDDVTAAAQREVTRREQVYRKDRPPRILHGRTVLLVDDGLATGATMRAAIAAVRHQQPARIVVAVPVAASSTCAALRAEVDEVVCVFEPEQLYAVGIWYDHFSQVSDAQVGALLTQAWQAEAHGLLQRANEGTSGKAER